jgi:hypothetical protein
MAGRVCVVSFHARGGEWSNVTTGNSVFEVVRNAMQFFADPFWKGPKPGMDTVFTVTIAADERQWRVRGRSALEADRWRIIATNIRWQRAKPQLPQPPSVIQ